MQHRQPQESSREGKLRAACDRCHDLKNRCIRIGGPDSRCGRCERLDIDCVYQKSSRMGRPKRKASVVLSRQQLVEHTDEPNHRRMSSSVTSDMMPDMTLSAAITVAGGGGQGGSSSSAIVDGSEMGGGVENISSASATTTATTTLIESPFDVMSFLTTPEGISSADLDWGVDMNQSAGTCNAALHPQDGHLFEETHHHHHPSAHATATFLGHGTRLHVGNGNLPSPDPTNNTESYHGTSAATPIPIPAPMTTTPSLTDRLVQLQGRLHRLLSAANGAHSGSGPEHVQEGLEAAKSFLGILQASLDCSQSLSQVDPLQQSQQEKQQQEINTSQILNVDVDDSQNQMRPDNGLATTTTTAINFITMQQTLTCYSYILSLLDRVVCILTTTTTGTTTTGISQHMSEFLSLNMNMSSGSSGTVSLNLGNFSLSSQPALNAEMVLYLVLRMVHYLRGMILRLAGRCREVVHRTSSCSCSNLGSGPGSSSSGSSSGSGSRVKTTTTESFYSSSCFGEGGGEDSSRATKKCCSSSDPGPGTGQGTGPSLADMSYAVSGLLIERERALMERLEGLTGQSQRGLL